MVTTWRRYDRAIRKPSQPPGEATLVVEAYGARLAVSASDADVLDRIVEGLPLGWAPSPPEVSAEAVEWRFAVLRGEDGAYRVTDGHGIETSCHDLELAIGLLGRQLRRYVGYHAPDVVFVHAGVVAHRDRAIVIPGHSFSGKSTLVAALVRAGATFYSDEYAVFDARGHVTPYREPLAMREPGQRRTTPMAVETLGGRAGDKPVPVGLVVATTYVPGADWRPRWVSTGEGVIALMEHAVPARDRPAQTLATLNRAVQGAVVLAGERGEADRAAAALMRTAES